MANRKKIKKLRRGNADMRRFAIISASRAKDSCYLPQLLTRLQEEPAVENRRHIVRAIGNIGGEQAAVTLLDLLKREEGVILGDVATALGRMRCRAAKGRLEELMASDIGWVSQQATYALKQIRR